MKQKLLRIFTLFGGMAAAVLFPVAVFADEIYEPMPGDYQNIMPYVILIAALVIGVQLVAGIILIIIFSVRKKKRRKEGE